MKISFLFLINFLFLIKLKISQLYQFPFSQAGPFRWSNFTVPIRDPGPVDVEDEPVEGGRVIEEPPVEPLPDLPIFEYPRFEFPEYPVYDYPVQYEPPIRHVHSAHVMKTSNVGVRNVNTKKKEELNYTDQNEVNGLLLLEKKVDILRMVLFAINVKDVVGYIIF
jgi:hypothetical protein